MSQNKVMNSKFSNISNILFMQKYINEMKILDIMEQGMQWLESC